MSKYHSVKVGQKHNVLRATPTKPLWEVYLIKAENGLYKIGAALDANKRFARLKTVSPISLEFVCVIFAHRTLETALHRQFKDKRSHGEWFALTNDDVAYIKSLATLP